MNDSHLDEMDLEMDRRLESLASATRTPALPDAVADLPWSVQLDSQRETRSFAGRIPGLGGLFGQVLAPAARLAFTLAIAGGFLCVVSNARPAAGGPNDIIGPAVTPTPSASVAASPNAPEVVLVPTSGVVDDVMANFVAGAVRRAENDGAAAVVIQLDTLGGSESSMLAIDRTLHARIPTIVWVGPSGAKAASAGTFITLSANLAYMAQSTNIGAASPVAQGGQDISSVYGQTEASKVMQDAIATMTSVAQERHPQAVQWAVSTVKDAASYSAEQAKAAQGINGIADSLDEVLAQADGQTVTTTAGSATIHVHGANVVTINEDFIQSFLHDLDDPNIAFILLVIGVLCIALEFFHPTILVGLAGALSLALSFYGTGSLPLNLLGVILVVLGVVMLILEPATPSHGLLTVGGLACFVVGAVAFYGSPGPYLPGVSVAWPIIGTMAILATLYSALVLTAIMRLRRAPLPEGTGMVGTVKLIGLEGKVQAPLDPVGTVHVANESWSAREVNNATVPRGARVKVTGQDGLTLIVQHKE